MTVDLPSLSPAARLRAALDAERPLQVVGVVNAYAALLARDAGFRAIYLSGAGVANASCGLPDLGFTTLDDVLIDVRRITRAVPDVPLLVDADTGWSDPAVTARALAAAGAAGMHIEDQIDAKRCGHRPGKQLVPTAEMVDRIRAAAGAAHASEPRWVAGAETSASVGRSPGAGATTPNPHSGTDPQGPTRGFVVMARTDAASVEGLHSAIDRAHAYVEAGADMVFAEALAGSDEYRRFTSALAVPVLANITEFGRTPLLGLAELRDAGVRLALYPLTAFRAMSQAAQRVYQAVRHEGTQRSMLDRMQTRAELYRILNYHAYEQELDQQLREAEEGEHGSQAAGPGP